MNPTLRKYLIVTVTTLAVAVCLPLTTRKTEMGHPPVKLRCVIDLKGEPVRGLTVGMNKIILREFADDHGLDIEFITPADTSNYLDSLQDETVDLLVMFRADSLHRDGFISTLPYRDSTVWVVRDDRRDAVRRLNAWISAMEQGGGIRKIGRTYLRRVGSSLTSISPYDDLVKKNAREMGWDWRLLSAMIYHESKFINESCSDRGAVGLMQIRNDRYSVDTLLDEIPDLPVRLLCRTRRRLPGAPEIRPGSLQCRRREHSQMHPDGRRAGCRSHPVGQHRRNHAGSARLQRETDHRLRAGSPEHVRRIRGSLSAVAIPL